MVAAGDVDGDGDLDVVTAAMDGPVAVLLGDGAGALAAPYLVQMSSPSALAVADLDGVGGAEIVVADADGIHVLAADGAVMAWAAGPFENAIAEIAVSDLDGDGRPDLLAGAIAGEELAVFRNAPP